jgi:hypothetical protein
MIPVVTGNNSVQSVESQHATSIFRVEEKGKQEVHIILNINSSTHKITAQHLDKISNTVQATRNYDKYAP